MFGLTSKNDKFRYALVSVFFVFILVGPAVLNSEETKVTQAGNLTFEQNWDALLQLSLKEKKGLTFFLNGQTIPGVVTNVIGDEGVEVKNQTHDRIIIRLDSVDAIALN